MKTFIVVYCCLLLGMTAVPHHTSAKNAITAIDVSASMSTRKDGSFGVLKNGDPEPNRIDTARDTLGRIIRFMQHQQVTTMVSPWAGVVYESFTISATEQAVETLLRERIPRHAPFERDDAGKTKLAHALQQFVGRPECEAIIVLTDRIPDDFSEVSLEIEQIVPTQPVAIFIVPTNETSSTLTYFNHRSSHPNYFVDLLESDTMLDTVMKVIQQTNECAMM